MIQEMIRVYRQDMPADIVPQEFERLGKQGKVQFAEHYTRLRTELIESRILTEQDAGMIDETLANWGRVDRVTWFVVGVYLFLLGPHFLTDPRAWIYLAEMRQQIGPRVMFLRAI